MMLPKSCRVVLRFTVPGKAQPAGSKSAFVPKNKKTGQPYKDKHGRIIVNVVDANPNTKDWQKQVAQVASQVWGERQLLTMPLAVQFVIYKVRTKNHYGTGRNADQLKPDAPAYPASAPDVLKLARGIEDALTGIVYRDDAQIVHEELRKEWGEHAGVQITIATMPTSMPIPSPIGYDST
jgi:Holliday junction resolvase RusA-like endonuclease